MSHILIVEDNELNRDMLGRRLKRRGFWISIAEDGYAAVEIALAEPRPDLVLMDLSLPEMDGLEATREIRRRLSGKPMPIIALTAHARREDRDAALGAGCDDFATKPVEFESLLLQIRQLLDQTGL